MRRLTLMFGRRRGDGPLELSAADRRPPREAADAAGDLDRLRREVGLVADYVGRLKCEIAALRCVEMHAGQLPAAREEMSSAGVETGAAVERIMAAAEAVLQAEPADAEAYREAVRRRATEIIEACSFQDILGQRLARAAAALALAERRLERFAKAVRIADAGDRFDRDAILRDARREVLLVEGPQSAGAAIAQDDVDRLFE